MTNIVFVIKRVDSIDIFHKFLDRFDWERRTKFLYVSDRLSVRIVLESNLQNIRGIHPDTIYTENFSSIDFFNIFNIYGTKLRKFQTMTY